eukprot:scaffold30968_cov66-Phaeocystis_antarctica.AAC.2
MHVPRPMCLRALVTGHEDHLEALLVLVGHLVRGGQLRGEACAARRGGGTGGWCKVAARLRRQG